MDSIKRCFTFLALYLLTVSCDNTDSIITPNLILEKQEIRLSAYAQSVSISLSSNVDFDIKATADWISASKKYSGSESKITIEVAEYDGTDIDRSGFIEIMPNGASEKLSITVVQEAMGIIQTENNIYKISSDEQKLTIGIKNNYDYNVLIPDEVKSWIEVFETNGTKAVTESHITLSIKKNEEYSPRKGNVVISIPSYNIYDTIGIIQDEGFESVRKLIKANKACSIFYSALQATGLEDSLAAYLDPGYPIIEYEWTKQALVDGYSGIHYYEVDFERGSNADRIAFPDNRLFKYTVFLVTDSILSDYNDNYCNGGIHNLEELRQYAYKVYPEGKELPDTSRASSLNMLISYHILPCWLSYDQLNTSQIEIRQRHLHFQEHDMEDFFETMLPHSIMRISTPYPTIATPLGIYINRRGTLATGLITEGIRIAQFDTEYDLPTGQTNNCLNGGYHYINKLLVYDESTKEMALNCRMRIMASTLSPDFINSGGRGRLNKKGDNIDKMSMAYKSGFCKNFLWEEDKTYFHVRYRDASFGYYNGDVTVIRGLFDIALKLPPVPFDDMYEIRISNNSLAGSSHNDRCVVQFFTHHYNSTNDADLYWRDWNWQPQRTPIDLSIGGDDDRIGMVPDNDDRYENLTSAQKEDAITQNDRLMRENGYMKAPDTYTKSGSTSYCGDEIRTDMACYRIIICNEYLKANEDYYLRIQKCDENPSSVCIFDFIEIVPSSVYSGINGPEDRH